MRGASMIRFAVLALLWGSNYLFIKIALEGLNPTQVALGRLMLGAATLLVFIAVRRQPVPTRRSVWMHLLVAALVGNALPYYLFAWAEQTIASNVAGVLNATTPLFTLAIAFGTGLERHFRGVQVAGLLLGFAGVLVILEPWQAEGLAGTLPGQLAALSAAASYGIAFVYIRRFLTNRGVTPLVLAAGQLAAASVLIGLITPFTGMEPVTLSTPVVWNMLILGVPGTGVAYIINYRLIQDEGSTATSTVTYLIPVVAVLAGFLVLAEPITWNLIFGAAIVLVGVALSQGRLGPRKTGTIVEAPAPRP